MANNIDALLDEREKTHGDYAVHAQITQKLKNVIACHEASLNNMQKEALDMIAHKIGRILAGNPNFKDHWDDIAGYARLVSQRLPSE